MVRSMYVCGHCNIAFACEHLLDQHCEEGNRDFYPNWPHRHDGTGFGCNLCNDFFWREDDCIDHMQQADHFGFECRRCYHWSWTKEQRVKHEHERHLYCKDCDRDFDSPNNLKQHLNSRTHRGQNITCPFCRNAYATATGLTHHLESGSCRNATNLNRDTIYKFVRAKDPHGVISKKLIEGGPSSSSTTTYTCTDRAWNGRRWECYLCHRGFNSRTGLNQHLNSPAHQQNLYHCVNRSCRHEFKTLAAIINHLESETCGAMRFEQVQRGIHGMVSGNRLIGF